MLTTTDDGGMEIAERRLQSRRGGVESLILGEARALPAEAHKDSRKCFKVRGKVYHNL